MSKHDCYFLQQYKRWKFFFIQWLSSYCSYVFVPTPASFRFFQTAKFNRKILAMDFFSGKRWRLVLAQEIRFITKPKTYGVHALQHVWPLDHVRRKIILVMSPLRSFPIEWVFSVINKEDFFINLHSPTSEAHAWPSHLSCQRNGTKLVRPPLSMVSGL